MPGLYKKHIYITFPEGEIEVFPKNENISYGWEFVNEVWRKKIDTQLFFQNTLGPGGQKLFDKFAYLELEACDCHRLNMRITLECEGDEEADLFLGVLIFIDGEWFFDFCSVGIKPRVRDPFECLFNNWETEHNLFDDTGDDIELNIDTGNFETHICLENYNEDWPGTPDRRELYESDCLTGYPGDDWSVIEHVVQVTGGGIEVRTTWIRETFTGTNPPGGGWHMVTPTLWTRPVILQGPTIEESEGDIYIATWTQQTGSLDNGRLLSEVLLKLFSVCSDYGLISDFLGINPDGTAPANADYAYAEEWFHGAVLFATSDVVRHAATQNATRVMITLASLVTQLRIFAQLKMWFDYPNNSYRIEHISYNRFNKLINLVNKRPLDIRGYNTYTYDKVRVPQKETFKFGYSTNDTDWDDAGIVYQDCNDAGSIIDYKVDAFHTDFASLFGSLSTEIDITKGMVLVAQESGYVNHGIGDISGLAKANVGLSWANIVKNLWRWRRPTCSALVNGDNIVFKSVFPKIRQRGFRTYLCCNDILALDPSIDKVRTGLGNGEIDIVAIDIDSGAVDFEIILAPPITLVDLTITISVSNGSLCYFTPFIFQTNENFPAGVSIEWNFGAGAVPATAIGEGPHSVYYTTTGTKTITVTATYGDESQTATTTVSVLSCPGNLIGSVKNESNVGLANVNVRLYHDDNIDGISDGGSPVRNVNTNSSGNYSMASLPPGNYVIVLTMPSGYDAVVSGKDDSPDGDLAPDISTTDTTIPVTITPGKLDQDNNYILHHI